MSEKKKIIDPLHIPTNLFPIFVFSDDLRGFIGWAIKSHSKGSYNHCMIMTRPGFVATQGWTYKEVPIETYMKGQHRLKFWYYKDIDNIDIVDISTEVVKDLNQSWWKKSYDWLGIIGQAINIRWLQNPFKNYCSERVAKYARLINKLEDKIPKQPSPAELNQAFINIPQMKIYGYWFKD